MDKHPNALLTTIRSALRALTWESSTTKPDAVRELIENMTTLDRHLSRGGAPPADWNLAYPTPAAAGPEHHPTNDLFQPAQTRHQHPVDSATRYDLGISPATKAMTSSRSPTPTPPAASQLPPRTPEKDHDTDATPRPRIRETGRVRRRPRRGPTPPQ